MWFELGDQGGNDECITRDSAISTVSNTCLKNGQVSRKQYCRTPLLLLLLVNTSIIFIIIIIIIIAIGFVVDCF